MSKFYCVFICILIPIVYVFIYIAGKYDLLSLICKMLKEYSEEKEKDLFGEWIADNDCGGIVLSCSVCNEHYWIDDVDLEEYRPNFCPRCGARMIGEKKHDKYSGRSNTGNRDKAL